MRPLWFEYPDDARTYLVEDQYLVGRDLLVAPVVRESATKRGVYFPAGDDWVDWWTGKTYRGGTDAEVEAPLDRLPLFARAGAVIPTQPAVRHTGEMTSAPLSLVVVRGADGAGSLYEDAGEGYEYQRGDSQMLEVIQGGNNISMKLTGNYSRARRVAALELLGVGAAPRAVLAGNDIELEPEKFDPATGRLIVPLRTTVPASINIQP